MHSYKKLCHSSSKSGTQTLGVTDVSQWKEIFLLFAWSLRSHFRVINGLWPLLYTLYEHTYRGCVWLGPSGCMSHSNRLRLIYRKKNWRQDLETDPLTFTNTCLIPLSKYVRSFHWIIHYYGNWKMDPSLLRASHDGTTKPNYIDYCGLTAYSQQADISIRPYQ